MALGANQPPAPDDISASLGQRTASRGTQRGAMVLPAIVCHIRAKALQQGIRHTREELHARVFQTFHKILNFYHTIIPSGTSMWANPMVKESPLFTFDTLPSLTLVFTRPQIDSLSPPRSSSSTMVET